MGPNTTANLTNDNRSVDRAKRFVRFDTGNSRDAEFASRAQAWTAGRRLVPTDAAAAAMTGVSRTTVASRLRVAVMTAAEAKASVSNRFGCPGLARRPRAPTPLKTTFGAA